MFCLRNSNRAKCAFSLLAGLALLLSVTAGMSAEGDKKDAAPAATDTKKATGDAYPLPNCIVSGHALDSMGGPVSYTHEGREIKFCCGECKAAFEKDPAKYLKKIDDEIIKAQKPGYPTDKCVVSDDKLGGEMGKPVDYVIGNRYVQLCCKECIADLKKDPSKALAKLDAASIAKQKETYPLDTCVVSGKKLGSMGEPIDKLVNGRLVRLCCAGCPKAVDKDPAKYLSKIDEAAKAKAAEKK